MTRKALTANAPIGEWLDHPEGGAIIRELLAQGGFDEQVLAPLRQLPLQQLVSLSQGALSQDVIDDMVTRANGGTVPNTDAPITVEYAETTFQSYCR